MLGPNSSTRAWPRWSCSSSSLRRSFTELRSGSGQKRRLEVPPRFPRVSLCCVFLFQESDLTFRLASGLVIWQPMWEHRQPDIPAFAALIKPIRNIVSGGDESGTRLLGRSNLSNAALSAAKRNSPVNNQCSPGGAANPGSLVSQALSDVD